MAIWPKQLIENMVDVMERGSGATAKHATLAEQKPKPRTGNQAKAEKMRMTKIAEELLDKALNSGQVRMKPPKFQELGGGNTALQVSIASMELDFVFKADSDHKLVREARTIDDLRGDLRLGTFCSRLPRVYATYEADSPYAYLMERFDDRDYPSMKEIFFDRGRFDEPSPEQAKKIVEHAVDALKEAYEKSRDPRQQVRMMGEAYYGRIAPNLEKAAKQNEAFRPLPLEINGQTILSWDKALDLMQQRQDRLQQLSAPFVAVVHGDPNPGNILVKREGDRIVDIKFIDLKDWKYGDYLFDLAKVSHFLLHTGPIEELQLFSDAKTEIAGDRIRFTYNRTIPEYIEKANTAIESKIKDIASEFADKSWELRYSVALASNLLGLIPRRWSDGQQQEAKILYAEGMIYLNDFIRKFERYE